VPVAFKAYAIQINPVAQTKRDPRFDRADKRPLSTAELKTYWQLIKNTASPVCRRGTMTGTITCPRSATRWKSFTRRSSLASANGLPDERVAS